MLNPLVHKLGALANLSPEDCEALEHASGPTAYVAAGDDILPEGRRPTYGAVLLSGLACRYKAGPDGGRQVLAFLLPGDIIDFQGVLASPLDHAVSALGACRIATIHRNVVNRLLTEHPAVALAVWRDTLLDAAILREWMFSLGQRASRVRMAHLFCELRRRMQARSLTEGEVLPLPITQQQLGDALGLSVIHIQRTLKSLAADGLMTFRSGRLTILDPAGLAAAGDFDPTYLHPPTNMPAFDPSPRAWAHG